MNYRTASHPEWACPRCLEPLAKRDLNGMRLDICEKCGGIFAGRAISDAIARAPDRALVDAMFALSVGRKEHVTQRHEPKLPCPECGIEMARTHIRAAVCDIDECEAHGTWFDPHEVHKVTQAHANERRRRGH